MPDPLNDGVGRGTNNAGFNYSGYGSTPEEPAYGQTDPLVSDHIKEADENKDLSFKDNEQTSGIRDEVVLTPEQLQKREKAREILEANEDQELWDFRQKQKEELYKKILIGGVFYLLS